MIHLVKKIYNFFLNDLILMMNIIFYEVNFFLEFDCLQNIYNFENLYYYFFLKKLNFLFLHYYYLLMNFFSHLYNLLLIY